MTSKHNFGVVLKHTNNKTSFVGEKRTETFSLNNAGSALPTVALVNGNSNDHVSINTRSQIHDTSRKTLNGEVHSRRNHTPTSANVTSHSTARNFLLGQLSRTNRNINDKVRFENKVPVKNELTFQKPLSSTQKEISSVDELQNGSSSVGKIKHGNNSLKTVKTVFPTEKFKTTVFNPDKTKLNNNNNNISNEGRIHHTNLINDGTSENVTSNSTGTEC